MKNHLLAFCHQSQPETLPRHYEDFRVLDFMLHSSVHCVSELLSHFSTIINIRSSTIGNILTLHLFRLSWLNGNSTNDANVKGAPWRSTNSVSMYPTFLSLQHQGRGGWICWMHGLKMLLGTHEFGCLKSVLPFHNSGMTYMFLQLPLQFSEKYT